MTPPAHKTGFSLIENIIVLGVLGILLSIGIPALKHYRETILLDASVKTLAADLRALQNQALLKHTITRFSSSAITLAAPIKLQSFASIAFSPSGYPIVGGSGTIVLANSLGKNKKVVVSSLGRIRIE